LNRRDLLILGSTAIALPLAARGQTPTRGGRCRRHRRLLAPDGADEEGTLAQLKACRRELIDPGIAQHRGRIVKTTGDGLLIEFSSPVEAVRWAVAMQHGMIERNADVADGRRIQFRIGINLKWTRLSCRTFAANAVRLQLHALA